HPRLKAAVFAARHYGVDLDPQEFPHIRGETTPSSGHLVIWLRNAGIRAQATRLRWRHLMRFQDAGPVLLLFTNGNAGVLIGVDAAHNLVVLKNPLSPDTEDGVLVDELRLAQLWAGEAVLLAAQRHRPEADEPFALRWIAGLLFHERSLLRDVA